MNNNNNDNNNNNNSNNNSNNVDSHCNGCPIFSNCFSRLSGVEGVKGCMEGDDICGYCGSNNGPNGESRMGFDCCHIKKKRHVG